MPDMIVGRERRKAEKANGLEAFKSIHGDVAFCTQPEAGSRRALGALTKDEPSHTRSGS